MSWTPREAHAWHVELPWLVGCNFTPAYAINHLEMWQEETFDLDAPANTALLRFAGALSAGRHKRICPGKTGAVRWLIFRLISGFMTSSMRMAPRTMLPKSNSSG